LVLFTLEFVSSAGPIVGVSPGSMRFENVLRGGYAERLLTVTVDSDEPVFVSLEPRGNISDWLNYSNNFTASRGNPGRIVVSVRPPSDVPNGNYTGFLRVSTSSLTGNVQQGNAVGLVRAVLDVAITVEVTDYEILECSASAFSVESAEQGDDIVFKLNVNNRGNIRLNPDVIIDIWDQEQVEIVKSITLRGGEVLPTREGSLELRVESDDFDFDQYWADIEVPDCYSSDTLTFDVYEPGALKASGILVRLTSSVWAEVGNTIPISALFENNGEKNVDARFEGRITRDGRIIQVLESTEQEVLRGEETNFTFFFTPERAGKYIASGRVFYDKKRTFEASTVMNVRPKSFTLKTALIYLFYLVVLVLIGYLIVKIRRERRRYASKVRQAGFKI
jgi:hypothetical protein